MKKEFYFKTLYHFSNFCYKHMEISDSDLEALLFLTERAINGDETCQYLINRFTKFLKFDPSNQTEIRKIISIARDNCYQGYGIKESMKRHELGSQVYEDIKFAFEKCDYIPTEEFISTLENLLNVHGLYFLYDENKNLIYIGKSKNLGSRILDSTKERQGFYLKYKLPLTKSDTNILELYYISKFKPKLNSESKEIDDTTIKIDYKFLEESDFILIKEKIEND